MAITAVVCAAIAVAWVLLTPTPALPVTVMTPERRDLATQLDLNAVVINRQVLTITALLDGEIASISAREGDVVAPGDRLAVLDSQRAESLLDQAEAQLSSAEQKLDIAERHHRRMQNLSRAGNTSQQTLDESLDAWQSRAADVDIAASNVAVVRLQLQNTAIAAPFDGVVTRQFAEVGQWVEAGTPLFEVVASDGYLIEAQVDASDWAKVKLGQAVTLSTESAPGLQWESTVSWIAPSVSQNQRQAKSVSVRFEFGDAAPRLLLGQDIDAELELERVNDVLSLPLSAMQEDAPGSYSVFVARDGRALRAPLDVGLINATHAEIAAGLSSDDHVILSREPLTDGQAVELVQRTDQAALSGAVGDDAPVAASQ